MRPRGDTSRPWSWARATERSAGITASGSRPKTRATSAGVISALEARLTTNPRRSSSASRERVQGTFGRAERAHVEREHLQHPVGRIDPGANVGIDRVREVEDDRVGGGRSHLDGQSHMRCLHPVRILGGWSEQHAEAFWMGPERFVQVFGGELRTQRRQVGERMHIDLRRADRRAHLGEQRVAVDQHARPPSTGERPCEVRRHERRPRSPARRVHRDHARASVQRRRNGAGRGRGDRQRVTIRGPHEEAVRARADRGPERADRFAGVDGEEGRCSDGVGDERRLPDHRVRFELPHGLPQLPVVGGGRHHPRPAAPIEEMHDLFDDVVLLHDQHDPRDVFHVLPPRPNG